MKPGEEYDPDRGYAARYDHDHETARRRVLRRRAATERRARRADRHRARRLPPIHVSPRASRRRSCSTSSTAKATAARSPRESANRTPRRSSVDDFRNGWAKDQRTYYAVVLSTAPEKIELFAADGTPAKDENAAARAVLHLPAGTEELLVKVGVSPVSETNAAAQRRQRDPPLGVRQDCRRGPREVERCAGRDRDSDGVERPQAHVLYGDVPRA